MTASSFSMISIKYKIGVHYIICLSTWRNAPLCPHQIVEAKLSSNTNYVIPFFKESPYSVILGFILTTSYHLKNNSTKSPEKLIRCLALSSDTGNTLKIRQVLKYYISPSCGVYLNSARQYGAPFTTNTLAESKECRKNLRDYMTLKSKWLNRNITNVLVFWKSTHSKVGALKLMK